MEIEFDPAKRDRTLAGRGVDMAEAAMVFAGDVVTYPDVRRDYAEPRFLTIGRLRGRMVVLAWTPRGQRVRIISMRKANGREKAAYGSRV